MSVFVACKNDEDPIKNEGARVVTTLFIDFSHAQGQLTQKLVIESCRNSNPSMLLWLTLLPARLKKICWKMKVLEWSQRFSHYKLMVIFQTLKGSLLISPSSDTAQFRTHSRFYSCPCYLQEERRTNQK